MEVSNNVSLRKERTVYKIVIDDSLKGALMRFLSLRIKEVGTFGTKSSELVEWKGKKDNGYHHGGILKIIIGREKNIKI